MVHKKANVRHYNRIRELIPPWNMPADPVKAVWWFLHWLLQVLVHFFWLAILGMVVFESYGNGVRDGIWSGLIAGIITLLVGAAVWGSLYLLLFFVNVGTNVSQTISDVNNLQQRYGARRPGSPFNDARREPNVVEGSIADEEEEK